LRAAQRLAPLFRQRRGDAVEAAQGAVLPGVPGQGLLMRAWGTAGLSLRWRARLFLCHAAAASRHDADRVPLHTVNLYRHSFRAMASLAEVQIEANDASVAQAAFGAVQREVARIEAKYSRYRADSALS